MNAAHGGGSGYGHTADQVIRDRGWEQVPLEIRCNAAADQAAGRAARAALVVPERTLWAWGYQSLRQQGWLQRLFRLMPQQQLPATCGEDPGDGLVEPTEAEGEVGSMACLLAAPPTGWKFGRALWACVETFFCGTATARPFLKLHCCGTWEQA